MRRSVGTRAKYAQHLRELLSWAGDRPLTELTAQEIEFQFLGPWSETVSSATLRNRIAALRSLFEFAERFDFIELNPMRRIEPPPRNDRMGIWLRPEQDVAVLDATEKPAERMIVHLLRFTGLRVSEACALEWSHIDVASPSLTVVRSKTRAGLRTIPLHPILIPHLRAWQRWQGRETTYVLETKNGTPMKPQFVWRVVRRVGNRAGIHGLNCHCLRRTYGSSLINDGLRLEVVSKLLGHASTVVTERSYAELLNETIAREARAVFSS
jgi:integrase/recombinase XerD